MAMADIAAQTTDVVVPLSKVAERQGLPVAYLEQLFVSLRRSGLVESARGRSGGYRLSRAPEDISVAAIMSAVDEETRFTRCTDGGPGCTHDKPCVTHELWTALGRTTSEFLARVSLADVISRTPLVPELKAKTGSASSYLDYNATAPLRAEAKAAMVAALDYVGNPSSIHAEGRRARAVVESAREHVARLVGAKPSEVVFTSGATEANAWALAQPWDAIFASGIEHDSVLAPARAANAKFVDVAVGNGGLVTTEALKTAIAGHAARGHGVLALQMANNETGIIQDVASVAAAAREHGLFVHCDAVQTAGRLPVDFASLGLDTMSLSAHKIGGPKGIGALVIRDRIDLAPLIRGGGQERRRRAGTENVAAIAGFGAAAEAALAGLEKIAAIARLRDRLEAAVAELTPDAVIIGVNGPRLANTSCFALPGKLAETLVIRLDLAGVAVSAGAACSSGKVGASHVLEAMGLPREIAEGAIRVSLGHATTEAEIDRFIAVWKVIAGRPAIAA